MPAPWIEAWKAWLARGAELFVKPPAPGADARPSAQRVPPAAKPHAPHDAGATKLPPTHRSGRRHG